MGLASEPLIASLFTFPEGAKRAVFAVWKIFTFLVRAAHVPCAGGNRFNPMFLEKLLDLPLDLRACCHIGCNPALDDRLSIRRFDDPGCDLGRDLVVGVV